MLFGGQAYPLSTGMLYLNGRNASHEQITNPEDIISVALNISQHHAIRSIQAYYGMTFTQFRNQSRLSAAARLLAEDDLGISEIAEAVGFSSTAYFRRLFSQVYGVSLSAYRSR